MVYLWRRVSADELARKLRPLYQLVVAQMVVRRAVRFPVRPADARHQRLHRPHARPRPDRSASSHSLAWIYRGLAAIVSVVGDRWIIDNGVDTFAEKTWDLGLSLRSIQTGRLRQYVMFIVVGTIVLFVVASLWWKYAVAG